MIKLEKKENKNQSQIGLLAATVTVQFGSPRGVPINLYSHAPPDVEHTSTVVGPTTGTSPNTSGRCFLSKLQGGCHAYS